jgi:hypothetical protein
MLGEGGLKKGIIAIYFHLIEIALDCGDLLFSYPKNLCYTFVKLS